jgi:signal transduction histidine kinase/DNA-binding response OmpR family regulator
MSKMIKKIKILHIEDNEDDAFLIERALKKGGYDLFVKRVETAQEIEQALKADDWDIILSDFDLPNYSGIAALELVMDKRPDLPFILVSGAVGEEMAVELMRKGAVDYIMKDNLSPLVPVVDRELAESKNRRIIRENDLAMQSIVKGIVGTTGEESFEKILQGLCNLVGAESGLIGVVDKDSIDTLSALIDHKKSSILRYDISGSPCQVVMDDGFQLYSENVCGLFPKDKILVEMGIESYVGVSLQNTVKKVIGVLCIFSGHKIKIPDRLKDYMEIVAAKAASEIERIKSEKERLFLEEQLHQSQKMESIGTLTGGIAHDFNNIMGIIVGNTELALEDVPKWNPAHASLEQIKSASLRAAGIVKQLLSFSRKTNQKMEKIQILPIVKDALQLLRPTIPSTIDIQTEFIAKETTVKADPTQINQVIINICINASHAMEETGGVLKILVDNMVIDKATDEKYPLARGKYLKITITDTGHGMDPLIINRIFDPYFTTKEIGKGSGMGLAAVHGIIKNHRGKIFVDSRLEKGSVFTLFFPLAEGKAVIETGPNEEAPLGKERILFVDDEFPIVDVVQKILKRLGYQVEAQTSPRVALEIFKTDPGYFDLVMTDMTMPEMNGITLAENLRDIRPDIPIIICTGHSSMINKEKARAAGFEAYVMKPITTINIANTLRKVLDKK